MLNIGCGKRKMAGYVNIDFARTADVICDIRYLPFKDESISEIVSIHAIEHIYSWDAMEMLKEWRRVLKYGGKIAIECPNILSACKEMLDGCNPQMTMWPLYGDPAYRDPHNMHKWGYTPETLIALMKKSGFASPKREQARFKLGEPRDMRVEAVK